MYTKDIKNEFKNIGASVKFGELLPRFPLQRVEQSIVIDVKTKKKKEFFEILVNPHAKKHIELTVLDIQKKDRHLLLNVKENVKGNSKSVKSVNELFLCGHDERHLFVAALKGFPSNVHVAKEYLKPDAVVESQKTHGVKFKDRNKRKNDGFVRQGEWFFIPSTNLVPDESLILKKEPLRRGRGKPHIAQFLYRHGGTTVYVSEEYPNGLTQLQYSKFLRNNLKKKLSWRTMTRNPAAYVKGRISHPDHKPIVLPCWHRVVVNGEAVSDRVAFLD